ncbi:hypothetical protein OnM2_066012 [Erysiphe neolycopersici]|uniref:Uncharacterized protein n=1 Tax=Erysiphe neolycopersici TaxID=212602 RepID=A0A420HMS5_9PEZI|nr:hypothetical protein OnM2_066012 [Erysiphe neolycopersici]
MLLPSPIDYDVSRKPPKYPTRSLFPSFSPLPAASASGQSLTNVYSTCYALQMIIRSSETINEQISWQLSPSNSQYSLSPSERRFRARSKSGNCCRDNHLKSRSKYARYSSPLHSLMKRMNISNKKENSSDHIESKIKEEDGNNYNDASTDKKVKINLSTPKRHRIAHILFPKRSERPNSIDSGVQKSYKQEAPDPLDSSPDLYEKKADECSTEEDRFLDKLTYQKLKFPKIDWHNNSRTLNHQRENTGNRWNSLSYQAKSVLKEIREET